MKLTDSIAKILKKNGIKDVFGLQGGAVVHIFDSLESEKLNVTYCHHEESAALAAVANAKVTGTLGCAVITSGPGCTNAITGLLAAWQDSIPCIFLSGQVRSEHMSYGKKIRQLGTQEVPILNIVKPITKETYLIDDKESTPDIIHNAIKTAISGRPGPVWVDVPLNYQWEDIDFAESSIEIQAKHEMKKISPSIYMKVSSMLNDSKKPLFILGYGVRLSGSLDAYKEFLDKNSLKFVTTWTAADYFPTNHKNNLGIIGMRGQKGANKAVFESDLLICLGTHLSLPHTTTLTDTYAPQAKKIMVNIDKNQLENLNLDFDLIINEDLSDFIVELSKLNIRKTENNDLGYLKKLNWHEPYEDLRPNPNNFFRALTKLSDESTAFIVDGGGTALYVGFQSVYIKNNQRIICSSAISAMGTGLAEVIGVHNANKFNNLICIIGDGSFLMNIQDLQTIRTQNIPVIICVINNNGYLAIRNTQNEFLEGKLYGTHPDWSLEMPNIEKLSTGFQIPYIRIDDKKKLKATIDLIYQSKGPLICEVVTDENVAELFSQGYKDNEDGTFTPLPLYEMREN